MDIDAEREAPTTRGDRLKAGSRERREQQKAELRSTILSTAAELFLEQGYDRFSLRQVAERIGYSPTTVYLYFQNKDDLLFQVVYEGFHRFSQQVIDALERIHDPLQRLKEVCRVYVSFGLEYPAYYNLMFVDRTDFLEHDRPHGEKPGDVLVRLEEAVQEAINAGLLVEGDAVSLGDAMWAAVHGVVSLGTCMPMFDPARRQRAIDATLAMVFDGLRKR